MLSNDLTYLIPCNFFRFKAFAKLDKKSDETLSDYYKVFIAMCKRQAGVKLLEEERNLEGYIEEISEDHAKLVLDRLDLLSKLREIARHSKLDERIKLCENNLDTPDWWEPGKHDKELIRAVLKHGLYRSDQFILNDTEFPFFEAEKRYLRDLEAHIQQMIKVEREQKEIELKKEMKEEAQRVEDAEKAKMLEEEQKLLEASPEKSDTGEETPMEGSPKPKTTENNDEQDKDVETVKDDTEKDVEKAEVTEDQEKMETDQPEKVSETIEASEDVNPKDGDVPEKMETDDTPEKELETKTKDIVSEEGRKTPCAEVGEAEKDVSEAKVTEESDTEKDKEDVSKVDEEEKIPKSPKEVDTEEISEGVPKAEVEPVEHKEDEPMEIPVTKKEPLKEEIPEIENVTDAVVKEEKSKPVEQVPIKQAVELKSRYPDLEVFQPLLKLKQLDALHSDSKGSFKPFTNLLDTTMVVKWFRDFALEKRIGHIVYCIDNNEWPVGKSYSAYTGCLGIDLDAPLYETIKRIIPVDDNRRSAASTPDIITITTDKNITQQITEAAALRSSALSTQALNQSMAAVAAANSTGRGKGKKRHIAIDVETERAKLHALLNNTVGPGGQQSSDFKTPKRNMGKQSQAELLGLTQKALWEQAEQELNAMDMRSTRSSRGSQQSTQPPPAHQHQSSRSNDYKQNYKQSTVIPGTSSTLTPIDLSSRYYRFFHTFLKFYVNH